MSNFTKEKSKLVKPHLIGPNYGRRQNIIIEQNKNNKEIWYVYNLINMVLIHSLDPLSIQRSRSLPSLNSNFLVCVCVFFLVKR